MSLVGPELGALARSRCLDSGSALMGFGQITVITLVVEIQDGFASQTAFGFIHRCGPLDCSVAQEGKTCWEDFTFPQIRAHVTGQKCCLTRPAP